MPNFLSTSEIHPLLLRAIHLVPAHRAGYADVRAMGTRTRQLLVKNGVVTPQSGGALPLYQLTARAPGRGRARNRKK